MKTIGITGGVGSGKTAVLEYLIKHYNCKILIADEIAHTLQQPGQICYQAIVDLFGSEIVKQDLSIHRQTLSQKIFWNPQLLQQVNQIVHPAVKEYILEAMDEERHINRIPLLFVEAALLLEEHYDDILDEIWYVYAREDIRRERLQRIRNYDTDKIDRIIANQLPEEVFRDRCSVILENNQDLSQLYAKIDERLEEYR